jgi:FSR family fosmidomycin resistance protein-like MFS transporter
LNRDTIRRGGVFFMTAPFALALIVPGIAGVIILIGTALGSAAFHPAGTSEATRRGRLYLSNFENTATSLFFMFGQSGYFFGPILGGPLLDRWGPPGLLVLLILLFPAGVYLALRLEQVEDPPLEHGFETGIETLSGELASSPSVAFMILTTLRAWVQMTILAFLPKYLSDIGFRPSAYGPISALFMGGIAFGNVAVGWLADQFNVRAIIAGSLVTASVPLTLFPKGDSSLNLALLSLVAGLLIGASHSIIVVQAQYKMPGRTGVASGLVLGFTFASGSIGAAIIGYIADLASFEIVFFSLAILALCAGALALNMETFKSRPVAAPVELH